MEMVSEQLIEHLKRIEPGKTVDYSLGRLLKNRAEEKLAAFQERVEYCRKHYDMSAAEFYVRKIRNKNHTWADEETYFDWVTAIQGAEEMETEIAALEEILAHADG